MLGPDEDAKRVRATTVRGARRRSTSAPFNASRLVPSRGSRAAFTRAATCGGAPSTSIRLSANIGVIRASAYSPAAPRTIAKPTSSDRPDGSRRASAARFGPDWSGITAARARAACWGRR